MTNDSASDDANQAGPLAGSRVVAAIERALGTVSGLLLFFMMWVVFLNVIGRKGASLVDFLQPIPAAYELVQISLGIVIFTALPIVASRQGHITISLLDQAIYGTRGRWLQSSVVNLVSAIVLAVLAWRLLRYGFDLVRFKATWSYYTWLPKAWFAYAMTVLAAMALALHLSIVAVNLRDRFAGSRR
ncbi:MAG: TRAP transporter small permease subunit [Alphaproteobacteria bacterium]|nr:TRAP transporter small permease subunit [Alphaproteobacteria bacterium]